MSETWFTSDTHYGHKNILQYEKEARPFETIEEMHEVLIHNWNSVVAPADIVYHLGDFCFGRGNIRHAGRLNGKKRLVLGNHDVYQSHDYLLYFDKLYGVKFWEQCILSHMPVHPRHLGSRWFVNVHGHLHSNNVMIPNHKIIEDMSYFNVSVEQHNLTPVNADVIRARIKEVRELE